MKQLHVK